MPWVLVSFLILVRKKTGFFPWASVNNSMLRREDNVVIICSDECISLLNIHISSKKSLECMEQEVTKTDP